MGDKNVCLKGVGISQITADQFVTEINNSIFRGYLNEVVISLQKKGTLEKGSGFLIFLHLCGTTDLRIKSLD